MKFALINENYVVIQTQPHIQPHEFEMGFVVVPGDVFCGMIKQDDGSFINPSIEETVNENQIDT